MIDPQEDKQVQADTAVKFNRQKNTVRMIMWRSQQSLSMLCAHVRPLPDSNHTRLLIECLTQGRLKMLSCDSFGSSGTLNLQKCT
jgi:hypothetical protein